jgi:hypothetical protein
MPNVGGGAARYVQMERRGVAMNENERESSRRDLAPSAAEPRNSWRHKTRGES